MDPNRLASGSRHSSDSGSRRSTRPALAPAEAEAWAGTDEGRRFYSGAAEGWGEAHLEAGADPVVVADNVKATTSFYTGV